MKIGFYLRLSESDADLTLEGKEESNSIENQRKLLYDFLLYRDDITGAVTEYVDDGYSGTNFDRPAFKRMIEDAKKGNIHTIIVKDVSRLGRDYITTGDYVEQIFPMLHVRFIAVNNNYDSNKINDGMMTFDLEVSNLVNAFYSRDLSMKMRSANKARRENGDTSSNHAPFGYRINPEDSRKWFIDTEAAETVRLVFELAVQGMDTGEIARTLNRQELPTPWMYDKVHQIWKLVEPVTKESERLWDSSKVRSIIRNYEYTGARTLGKTRPKSIGSSRKKHVSEKHWVIIDDVNEGIVTKEMYEQAQAVILPMKHGHNKPSKNVFKGLIRCGNCNKALQYCPRGIEVTFRCSHTHNVGYPSKCCKDKYSYETLKEYVYEAIKNHMDILQKCGIIAEQQAKGTVRQAKLEISKNRRMIDELNEQKLQFYEFYANGSISKEEYVKRKNEVIQKIGVLESKISSAQGHMDQGVKLLDVATQVLTPVKQLQDQGTLTREMMQALVSCVYVYDRKHIEIKFNFEDTLKELLENQNSEMEK